jgi:hypothetical protein
MASCEANFLKTETASVIKEVAMLYVPEKKRTPVSSP